MEVTRGSVEILSRTAPADAGAAWKVEPGRLKLIKMVCQQTVGEKTPVSRRRRLH